MTNPLQHNYVPRQGWNTNPNKLNWKDKENAGISSSDTTEYTTETTIQETSDLLNTSTNKNKNKNTESNTESDTSSHKRTSIEPQVGAHSEPNSKEEQSDAHEEISVPDPIIPDIALRDVEKDLEDMNIIEVYTKFKKQFVILITGITGCGKTSLARNISNVFKFVMLDQNNYYKKDHNTEFILPSGKTVINWDTHDAIDWDALNRDVNKFKFRGVVVSGFALPSDKLDFDPNLHIQIFVAKQICVERRKKYIRINKQRYPEYFKDMEEDDELVKMNKLTYPYHQKVLSESKIDHKINASDLDNNAVFADAYKKIIDIVSNFTKTIKRDAKYAQQSRQKNDKSKLQRQHTIPSDSISVKYEYSQDKNSDQDHDRDYDSSTSVISCTSESTKKHGKTFPNPKIPGVIEIDAVKYGLHSGVDYI